jgi:hypothetical protein
MKEETIKGGHIIVVDFEPMDVRLEHFVIDYYCGNHWLFYSAALDAWQLGVIRIVREVE